MPKEHPTPWIFGRVCADFYLPKEALGSDEEAAALEQKLYDGMLAVLKEHAPGYVLDNDPGCGVLTFACIEYGRDMGGPS